MSNQAEKFHLCYVLYYSNLRIEFGVIVKPSSDVDSISEHILSLKKKAIETARLLQRSPIYDVCDALIYPVYDLENQDAQLAPVIQLSPGKEEFALSLKPTQENLIGETDSRYCITSYFGTPISEGWYESMDFPVRRWLFWTDGRVDSGRGLTISSSFSNAGYGRALLSMLDFYTTDPTASSKWFFTNKEWRLLPEFENTEE